MRGEESRRSARVYIPLGTHGSSPRPWKFAIYSSVGHPHARICDSFSSTWMNVHQWMDVCTFRGEYSYIHIRRWNRYMAVFQPVVDVSTLSSMVFHSEEMALTGKKNREWKKKKKKKNWYPGESFSLRLLIISRRISWGIPIPLIDERICSGMPFFQSVNLIFYPIHQFSLRWVSFSRIFW